jgi:4-amino-4-deoxy-L-arabinose transferase-like glycosyltransferase
LNPALDLASGSPRRWWSLATPSGIAFFAIALSLAYRLPTLASLPPWGDEVVTIEGLALTPLELIHERLQKTHSPTFFLLLQALGIDGSSLFLLRLPSAVADSLAAGLLALVALRLGGLRAGLALAVIYAPMPIFLEEAQDARPNALFFLCLALLLWSAAKLLDHPRLAAAAWRQNAPRAARRLRGLWVVNGLATVATLAVLPLGVFGLAAIDLAVLWRARRWRGFLRLWICQRLLTLLVLAPLLWAYADNAGRLAGNYWYADSFQLLLRTLRIALGAGIEYDPNVHLGYLGNRLLLGLFLVLVGLGALWGRRRPSLSLLLALAFGTQLLLFAVSLHTPLYAPRYFAVATPGLTLLAALGLAALWQRWRGAALLAGLGLFLLLTLQSLDAMQQLGKPRLDRAIAQLREAGVMQLGYFVASDHMATSLRYSLRDGPEGLRLEPRRVLAAAQEGFPVWVVEVRRVPRYWRRAVDFFGLYRCAPKVRGLHILAIARTPEALAPLCPRVDPSP